MMALDKIKSQESERRYLGPIWSMTLLLPFSFINRQIKNNYKNT